MSPAVGLVLHRGLRVGWMPDRPMSLQWDDEDVLEFAERYVRRGDGQVGHHWTPDRRGAEDFATGLAVAGHSYTPKKAKHYPGHLFAGIRLTGAVVRVGDRAYSGPNPVLPYPVEKEVTLPHGTVVDVTEVRLIIIEPRSKDEVAGGTAAVAWRLTV